MSASPSAERGSVEPSAEQLLEAINDAALEWVTAARIAERDLAGAADRQRAERTRDEFRAAINALRTRLEPAAPPPTCCQRTIRQYEARVWPIEGPTTVRCACSASWSYCTGEWVEDLPAPDVFYPPPASEDEIDAFLAEMEALYPTDPNEPPETFEKGVARWLA